MNPRTNVHSPRVPISTRGRGSDHTYRNPAPSSLSHRGGPLLRLRWRRLAVDAGQQHGADAEQHGERRVDEPDARDAERGAEREEGRREQRTEQDAAALDQAGRRVRRGELGRVAREPGEQRPVRRPHEREEPAHRAGRGVDHDRGRVEQRRHRSEHARDAHRRLGEHEDLLAREPVAQDRAERRDDRRGDQLDQRDDPDRRGPALVEREHHQGDEARPLADAERDERELRASEVGVAERGDEGSSRDDEIALDLGERGGRLGGRIVDRGALLVRVGGPRVGRGVHVTLPGPFHPASGPR